MVTLLKATYSNFFNTFERFIREEFIGITGVAGAMFLAIWGSNYLLIIKTGIKAWLCSHGIDTMCI